MTDYDNIDFYTDPSLVENPYPYFDHLRAKCPVTRESAHDTLAVTGYEEVFSVYRNTDDFSSCNSAIGPFAAFPEPPEGDDITDYIAEHRDQLPMHEHFVTMDPPEHTWHRSLLMRLITPKRLKQQEEFMWRLADEQLDVFLADERNEFIKGFSQPFALVVVADLLGVPPEDHGLLLSKLGYGRPGDLEGSDDGQWESLNPLEFLDEYFVAYIEDRRNEPRDDMLTKLATGTFPDGSIPEPVEVSRIATFLFGAGQETTARLLGAAMLVLAEHPELQERLRADRSLIPNFIEECLRYESPVKSDFRLAKRNTRIGEVDVPAGTCVALMNSAANRDPRRFDAPATFDIDRPNNRDHIAFGRGAHACPGGPLARAEGLISVERILDRMGDIRIDAERHGPSGDRHFQYEPTYILRGLRKLYIDYTVL